MLEHYEPRLQEWTRDLRRDLRKYKETHTENDRAELSHLKQLLDDLLRDIADKSGRTVKEWRETCGYVL